MTQNERQPTVAFEKACSEEKKKIEERRRLLNLNEDRVEDELCGVSLSGGGLRSAYFSLGIVHAFYKANVWRHVDYLSTVSGGSYIGSWLSSRIIKRRPRTDSPYEPNVTPLDDDFEDVSPRTDDRIKPEAVRWFSGRGKYLIRPAELGNKYLIGLFFVNVLVLSGIMSAAAFTAMLWRSLDLPIIRDRLAVVGIRGDVITPFVPLVIFVLLWLMAWSVSYWRRGAEAPGVFARRFLILSLASLGIGVAILLGNGDIALVSGEDPIELEGGWITGALGLLGAGLIPLLNPKRLLQSSLRPSKWWEKMVFSVVTFILLVGVPLAFVGLMARENISGFNTDPNRRIVLGDIDDDLAFAAMLNNQANAEGNEAFRSLFSETAPNKDPVGILLDELTLQKTRGNEIANKQGNVEGTGDTTSESGPEPTATASEPAIIPGDIPDGRQKKIAEEMQDVSLEFYHNWALSSLISKWRKLYQVLMT